MARALLHHWVSRFGEPDLITSDRGPQFSSAVCGLLNIKRVMTTAYHPQSNGMLERFHRGLKTALRARSSSPARSSQLPLILLHLRATPRDDFPRSPAEAVHGAQLVLPGQLLGTPKPPETFFTQLEAAMAGFQPTPVTHAAPAVALPDELPHNLLAASHIFVRRDGYHGPLQTTWDGLYSVLQWSRHVFRLQVGTREETVSTHRLKKAHVTSGTPDGVPRRCG